VGLFEVVKVDVAQQPKQGVGVWQGIDLREQQMQVGHELGTRYFAVGLAPGGELKDEHQQAVKQLSAAFWKSPKPGGLKVVFFLPRFSSTGFISMVFWVFFRALPFSFWFAFLSFR
jgi:hypothetical protein